MPGTRETLLQTLQSSKSPSGRTEAAFALCDLVDEDNRTLFAGDVAHLVIDSQVEVRCAGLALARLTLPASEAATLFVRHTRDAHVRVRLEAIGQLADLGLPEYRGTLAAHLEDKDFRIQFESARGIAQLGHEAGTEVLAKALGIADFRLRAAEVLSRFRSDKATPALQRAFGGWFLTPFERTQIAFALAIRGDTKACAYLQKRAAGRWRVDRALAIELLGDSLCPQAFEVLLRIANDEHDELRGTAVRGLGRLGDVRAVAPLLQLIPSAGPYPDHWILDLAEALHALQSMEALPLLRACRVTQSEARQELDARFQTWEKTTP
jgi:HEAT repeat protein